MRKWKPTRSDRARYDRKHQLKRRGLSEDDYVHLLIAQGGTCALCDARVADARGFRLFVDHDHTTGQVRGLLCGWCNRSLAAFGDNIEGTVRLLRYLLKTGGK